MKKNNENRNFIELKSGDIYCLEYIESIIRDEDNGKYMMYYKNTTWFPLTNDEYKKIKKLIKKYSNSYNVC